MGAQVFSADEAINEGSTAEYETVFNDADADGTQLDEAAITAILATLKDHDSGEVVNNRNRQDVRNANGGSLAADGTFTLRLDPDDNDIIAPVAHLQARRLTLEVTYLRAGGETGYLNHEVIYYVVNLQDV